VDPVAAYTFGPFRLDSAAGLLRRGDDTVPLAPKAFAVLEYLVQRPGQLVTKDQLLDAAWADVHVGDGALKFCVREIRRALQDDSRTPRFIETAHRRGYRFVAPVSIERHATVAAGAPSFAAPAPRPPSVARARRDAATDTPQDVLRGLPPSAGLVTPPATHYARSGDVNIAYQVVGGGPIDLVFVMGWVSHLDYFWAEPSFAAFLDRLASFSRLILIDKRGTGLSDRAPELPTLEQRMDDLRAVMDEVGSEQAALVGVSEGGPMCALFAATYPEKTRALVMIGTYAKRLWAPDYPWGPTREQREAFYEEIRQGWGGPIGLDERAPSMAHDPAFRAWWSTYLRMGASPGAALALTRMNAEIDIRDILPLVRVPTLVLHRTHDRCLNVEEGRYVASRIPGARFVELPGQDHLPFVGDRDALLDEMERFIIEAPMLSPFDRVLSTILHARIGGRTERSAFLDHAAREADWFRGRPLESSSERFVAAFDGPARAVRCATALAAAAGRFGVEVRAGLHAGECEIVGGRAAGVPVEMAAAIAACAAPAEVLVSRTVCDIVGDSGLPFEDAGLRRVGKEESFRLFRAWRG
jgi:pimeloyl-ACP methyl ester carboxylesterase/DNA-binding winged helix-turn-helix (wHTH) protein